MMWTFGISSGIHGFMSGYCSGGGNDPFLRIRDAFK
jgi:hypothetical protein